MRTRRLGSGLGCVRAKKGVSSGARAQNAPSIDIPVLPPCPSRISIFETPSPPTSLTNFRMVADCLSFSAQRQQTAALEIPVSWHRAVALVRRLSAARARAFDGFSTSLAVTHSRGRRFAFKSRRRGAVPFTMFRTALRLPRFAAEIRAFTKRTVP